MLSTNLTNYYRLLQHVPSSLTYGLKNFPGGHQSLDFFIASMLIYEFLKNKIPERRCTFSDLNSHFDPSKSHLGYYIHPYLKNTTSSLCRTNQWAYTSSWPTLYPSILVGDCARLSFYYCGSLSRVSFDTICNAPTPCGSKIVIRTKFKDCRLAHKTTSFFDVFHPHSYAA